MEQSIEANNSSNKESTGIDNDTSTFESDNEDFYFESDHLALRGNADYRAVLRAIVVLEAQKIEAGKHIDIIAAAAKKAMNNIDSFVQNLASGTKLDLPGPIDIENVRNASIN